MLKQILGEWRPPWVEWRWRATLVGLVIVAFLIPFLFLALPYLELFNDMAVQPKGKSQGTYGWWVDKQELTVYRPPVPGTIPMGYVATPRIDEKDAAKAAAQAVAVYGAENPLPMNAENLERGRKVYNTLCWTCHGKKGDADGPIVGPDLFPAPVSLHTKDARGYPPARIFHVITNGQNKMPSYADLVEPKDRWAVVHYIRALQKAKQMSLGK